MAIKIIDELIEERIDEFRSAFVQRAKVLFRDDGKQNRLSHPGEFGTYREAILLPQIVIFFANLHRMVQTRLMK